MLEAAPGIRAVTIFEEICRRHPELRPGVRLTNVVSVSADDVFVTLVEGALVSS